MNEKDIRRDHVLILEGKEGKRIFEKILNGPKVPYERLRKKTEEAKAKTLASRNNENN